MLPDWIPKEAWEGWIQMRKETLKKPLKTDRAVTLAINTLSKLREEGNDPGAVLDQSTLQGWQGLFPIKQEKREINRGGHASTLGKFGQITANNAQEWLEESA